MDMYNVKYQSCWLKIKKKNKKKTYIYIAVVEKDFQQCYGRLNHFEVIDLMISKGF